MAEKPFANSVLGLDLDQKELLGVHLFLRQGKPALDRVFRIPVDPEHSTPLNVKLLYTAGEQKIFRTALSKSLVATCLPSSEVLIRDLEIQLVKDKDIEKVLGFQAEPLLPYPIEEALLDRIVVEKRKESTRLTLAAVKKSALAQHLETWHSLHVEPELISCVPAGLAAFSGLFGQTEEKQCVLHLGEDESTCCVAEKGILHYSQASKKGYRDLLTAFNEEAQGDFSTFNFSTLQENSHPKLFQATQSLRLEITKLFFAISKQAMGYKLQQVLICGQGAIFPKMAQALCSKLNIELVYPHTNGNFALSPEELSRYALPIGIALTALPKSVIQINYRQEEYAYPFPWKRIKKPMAVYLTLSISLAAAILFFGNMYIAKQEADLKKGYVKVLTLMKKPFNETESEFQKTHPGHPSYETQSPDAARLSRAGLELRLALIEKELKDAPDTFPLLPKVPKVSDVLAWLATHPHIKGENEEGETRIALESFNYKMVKRPEENKKNEHYQVKVEIEFTSTTPRYAREFHDSLLAPNDLIDPKTDVSWTTERGRYRASFFLKDKTIYPTKR